MLMFIECCVGDEFVIIFEFMGLIYFQSWVIDDYLVIIVIGLYVDVICVGFVEIIVDQVGEVEVGMW